MCSFCILLPFSTSYFLQCGLQKYTFQVVSLRIKRTISLSRLAKVSKLISLCNLHPRTKELCWPLLDLRLLAKTAFCVVEENIKPEVLKVQAELFLIFICSRVLTKIKIARLLLI